MGHGPAVKLGKDNAASYKSKLGIVLFLFYTMTYFGFVVINATNPALMEKVFFGQTLAVLYGFFLIALAFVMAIAYNHFCTAAEKRLN